MGTEFPWRWGRGTISTNLDGIWGMSVNTIKPSAPVMGSYNIVQKKFQQKTALILTDDLRNYVHDSRPNPISLVSYKFHLGSAISENLTNSLKSTFENIDVLKEYNGLPWEDKKYKILLEPKISDFKYAISQGSFSKAFSETLFYGARGATYTANVWIKIEAQLYAPGGFNIMKLSAEGYSKMPANNFTFNANEFKELSENAINKAIKNLILKMVHVLKAKNNP